MRCVGSAGSKAVVIWTPGIGWMPTPESFSENSSAPKRLFGIGQGERGLTIGLGEFRELRDGQRAFQQRIGRMHMQVDEADFAQKRSFPVSPHVFTFVPSRRLSQKPRPGVEATGRAHCG